MQLNKLYVAQGNSRAEHAANIMQGAQMWANYDKLHADQFAASSKGQGKYIVVNAEGKIIGRDNKPTAALQKMAVNANGTLRHEDFLVIQDKIVEVRRRSLNGITDLQSGGLSFGVDICEQLVGFENVNEFQAAIQEMNPENYQNNDTAFTEDYTPNPITHQSFSVPWRQQGFDYKRSLGMTESVRQVAERLEETLFNGNTGIVVNFGGANQPLYGYTTHPNRGTGSISDWTLTTAAGLAAIVPETVSSIGAMFSSQGGVGNDSVMIYVANDIWTNLQNDYKVESTDTSGSGMMIVDRMRKIAQVKDVKPAEKLAAGEVVMVEMAARTVELAVATDIISVPHQKTNPMQPQVMTTYAAMVHQIKVDSNSLTGVLHLT